MTVLRDLLLDSRDGEWGKSEQYDQSVLMHVIRGTDFEDTRLGVIDDIPVRHISARHAARKTLLPWDILIETAGGSKDRPTGRTVLLTPSRFARFDNPITCASFARFLRIDPAKANPAFVFWLLQDLYIRRELWRFHTQHTGVARFQFTTFADNWPIKLPTMTDQCRIADILSPYDDLIENNTRRIAIFEDMARRLFEEWFIQRRIPAEFVDTDGWKDATIGDAFTLQRGFDLPTSARADGPYPVVAASGIHGFHRDYKVKGPGVTTGRSGTIGRFQYIENDFWPLNTALWVKEFKHGGPIFAYYLLSSLDLTGNNTGAAVPSLNRNIVHAMRTALPPLPLVDAFERIAGEMRRTIAILADANTNLRATRDLLLPKLISGQIEVRAAEEALEAAAA